MPEPPRPYAAVCSTLRYAVELLAETPDLAGARLVAEGARSTVYSLDLMGDEIRAYRRVINGVSAGRLASRDEIRAAAGEALAAFRRPDLYQLLTKQPDHLGTEL